MTIGGSVYEEQQLLVLILALLPSMVPKDRELTEAEAELLMKNAVKLGRAMLKCEVRLPSGG